ncbi:hypothetical protein LP421_25810 [Rhizobium sp. RCAM05350]|nr:hypothetical protein LP421_25810 [Rhizobium sp. RCAM05350]
MKDYAIAQRQIVAIARALVGEAKLVFMDEPTASLTQSETDHLLDIVRTLSASGVAVVFSQPPAGRGAGDFQPADGAARWRACRRLFD